MVEERWSAMFRKILRCIKRNILFVLPRKVIHSILYRWKHGEWMNWENPVTYDEKIHWLVV